MNSQLPAGLMPTDSRVELWTVLNNTDEAYFLTMGKTGRVKDAPTHIKNIIRKSLESHPIKKQQLIDNGYKTDDSLLEKYSSCVTGEFDGEPDIVDDQLLLTEYWRCPVRATCTMQVCNPLVVGPDNIELTTREIDILSLAGLGLYNKEMADQLGIRPETTKVHLKHVYKKSRLFNKAELTRLAYKKNLISYATSS